MSGNSCLSALHTAPIVIDFWRAAERRRPARARELELGWDRRRAHLGQVGELVLADLQLVAVLQAVGLHPPPVDVGAVERAAVVEPVVVAAADEQRVVARDGDVVEEHRRSRGGGRSSMRSPASAKLSPVRPPPERMTSAAPRGDDVLELDGLDLAGLADPVGGRRESRPPFGRRRGRRRTSAVARSLRGRRSRTRGSGWPSRRPTPRGRRSTRRPPAARGRRGCR